MTSRGDRQGHPTYIYYVSPKQINFIVPADSTTGSVPVVAPNNGTPSASMTATLQAFAPAFFLLSDGKHVIATHADGRWGPPAGFAGGGTPATSGETITLWGTGFGPTNPAVDGKVVSAP